jgi:coenzyme F420 hydrogenase subunit beta
MKPMPLSLNEIVTAGLCIGCGLCQGMLGHDKIELIMTPEGRERPRARQDLSQLDLQRVNEICPGVRVQGADPHRLEPETPVDLIWGPAQTIIIAYAGDPEIRHRGSTGGVLTALGQFLVNTGRVKFVLHVQASATHPMRTAAKVSFTEADVLEGAGSRYGPAAPLRDFEDVLQRGEDFALIAKPCDVNAVRNLARIDPRVDRHMKYALSLVCGGASDLTKSEEVLAGLGIPEEELQLFRYRGFGNPGPTRIETSHDRVHEIGYQDMWEDEAKWMIQPRCRICPDAIGEAADIVASDTWPGGGPVGEDEGFNGVLVRTARGRELFEAATAVGAIIVDRDLSFRDMDVFQPHQVRKKRAVWARLAGMAAAGSTVLGTKNLRIEACARLNGLAGNIAEARGARIRVASGRLGEPLPVRRRPAHPA